MCMNQPWNTCRMEEPEKAWLGLEPRLKLSGDASRIPYIDVRIVRHSRML